MGKCAMRSAERGIWPAILVAGLLFTASALPIVNGQEPRDEQAGSRPLALPAAGVHRAVGQTMPESSAVTRTASVLVVVVAGIGIVLGLARKFIPGLVQAPAGRAFQVLGQFPLGAKGWIYLVRCGPRVLILGATASQLTTLAEIADPEEIDDYVQLAGAKPSSNSKVSGRNSAAVSPLQGIKGQVDGMLDKIDGWKV